MRYSGARFEYGVIKLDYVDYDNNADKFYTIIIDNQDQTWRAHYGRNGTAGTMTTAKPVGRNNAVKQALSKMDKGYELVQQGVASFSMKPAAINSISRAPLRERKFI